MKCVCQQAGGLPSTQGCLVLFRKTSSENLGKVERLTQAANVVSSCVEPCFV